MAPLEKHYKTQLKQVLENLKSKVPESPDSKDAADFVESTELDAILAKFIVLSEATPKKLADFASKSGANCKIVDELLLLDSDLMKKMVWNDGPVKGKYAEAVKIYRSIHKQHAIEAESIFDRLALAIALEHADPIKHRNPEDAGPEADEYVDPVKRFVHYSTAYKEGELDVDFDCLTTWELRFVVDENEPDETKAWGRRTLRNFQPKHVLEPNSVWRYVGIVRTDIRYGSHDVKHDQPDLQFFQNILMNGGICGRRAFAGRFFLRAFGIPTTARPSKGHGALCHWTKDHGWVVNLGPGWGSGTTKTRYHKDVDFLATTKARKFEDDYWKVKRAQWAGDVHDEFQVFGAKDNKIKKIGVWYKYALEVQEQILAKKPDGRRLLESQAHGKTFTCKIKDSAVPKEATKVKHTDDGTIVIPAVSFETPKKVKGVQAAKSFLGGKQIYLPHVQAQGVTVLRGGCWKTTAEVCCSGYRLKSGGLGKYNNWGFRVALTADDSKACAQKEISLDVGDGVSLDMIYIPPGSFTMGGECSEDGRFTCVEVPHHEVQLTSGFYLGKYPVTQAQYTAVMGKNPSKSTKHPDCPVDNIAEVDARDFIEAYINTFGKDLRLPSEAEWEYACRAGSNTKYFFGDGASALGEYAWYHDNAEMKSHPVGQLKPNAFGLYDMYGNVVERINDKYEKSFYAKGPRINPTGPSAGTKSHFEFKVKIAEAGKYSLVANVVTMNHQQSIKVSVDTSDAISLDLPFTLGSWQTTDPIFLELKKGANILRFWRDNPPQYGVAVKDFTLQLLG